MGLAPKEKMLSHLRRIVYYATMRSEDIGDRCPDAIGRGGTMSEEDFVALASGALKADQQGLAALFIIASRLLNQFTTSMAAM